MLSIRLHALRAAALVLLLGASSACSSAKSSQPPPAPPPQPALWGDMKPVVSVKELMEHMIDPASDYIFDSVSTVIDPKGNVIEKAPKTDEDWEKLRIGAVTLAEGVYLLKVQRPFTPAGDENHSVGPDATELSPAQILAKVQKDPVEWNARIEALRNVGLEVMEIAKKKDPKELWEATENLDEACEACHRSYWYPKEDQTFYRELDRQLKAIPNPSFPGKSPRRSK
jgi:cytochrome c556